MSQRPAPPSLESVLKNSEHIVVVLADSPECSFGVQGSRAALGKLSISGLWQTGWEEGGSESSVLSGSCGSAIPFEKCLE